MSLDQPLDASRTDFEKFKKVTQHNVEYWSARALMPLLGYATWRGFEEPISRAKTSCAQVGLDVNDHFAETSKMVAIGSGAGRPVDDYFLSRYACYLIAQNGDPSKREIAAAQTYFAMQTRRQEIQEQLVAEDQRIAMRERLKTSNKRLAGAAKDAGVRLYGVFQDDGYKGLYGGKGLQQIKAQKGIPANKDLLDHIGPTELAANDFRATQTEERLRREGIHTQESACKIHGEVGVSIRKVIREAGNTLPENLLAEPDIKRLLTKRERDRRAIIARVKERDEDD